MIVEHALMWIAGDDKGKSGKRRAILYMVTPYMDHDLSGMLTNPDIRFTDAQVKCYMLQLLEGLRYLHDVSVDSRLWKGTCADVMLVAYSAPRYESCQHSHIKQGHPSDSRFWLGATLRRRHARARPWQWSSNKRLHKLSRYEVVSAAGASAHVEEIHARDRHVGRWVSIACSCVCCRH